MRGAGGILVMLLSGCAAAQGRAAPVESAAPAVGETSARVRVFHSAEDGSLESVTATLRKVRERFAARVTVTAVDIDAVEGYRAMRAAERAAGVNGGFADVEAFVDRLPARGKKPRPVALLGTEAVNGSLVVLVDRILHAKKEMWRNVSEKDLLADAKAMGGNTVRMPVQPRNSACGRRFIFEGEKVGAAGYARVICKTIACPVCNDAQFVVIQKPSGEIFRVKPVIPLEVRGKRIDGKAFLKQFKGRKPGDRLRLGVEIDGITGATKTARKYVEGVNEVLNGRLQSPPASKKPAQKKRGGDRQ